MKKKIFVVVVAVFMLCMVLVACAPNNEALHDSYTLKQIDLTAKPTTVDAKYDSLFGYSVVDDSTDYMAHPDSVMLKDNKTMATFYPSGHGKGEIFAKTSTDGINWTKMTGLPTSWKNSQETPTVYKLDFNDGSQKFVLISANPTWGKLGGGDGFNASTSEDGYVWSPFEEFYGKDANGKRSENFVAPIVAMASLTRLKDKDGNWRDAWMGFFHDDNAYNYKTILTFDSNGKMQWSAPVKYMEKHRKIEKQAFMCEVEVIRSEKGMGDTLLLIARSNGQNRSKSMNSLISISKNEGETWSAPKEAPVAYNGERHKADWLEDGRLFITFRSINRTPENFKIEGVENIGFGKGKWYSEGWVAWVGTFEDLLKGKEGQYRIKLAHTYLNKQEGSFISANGDTGYCGNVVMADGRIMTTSYGIFDGKSSKTFIASKVIDIKLVDEIINGKLL